MNETIGSDPNFIELLGTVADQRIATKFGCSRQYVHQERVKRGIPKCVRVKVEKVVEAKPLKPTALDSLKEILKDVSLPCGEIVAKWGIKYPNARLYNYTQKGHIIRSSDGNYSLNEEK